MPVPAAPQSQRSSATYGERFIGGGALLWVNFRQHFLVSCDDNGERESAPPRYVCVHICNKHMHICEYVCVFGFNEKPSAREVPHPPQPSRRGCCLADRRGGNALRSGRAPLGGRGNPKCPARLQWWWLWWVFDTGSGSCKAQPTRVFPYACFYPPPQKIVQTQCWPFGFLTDFSKKERCDVRLFSLACFFFGSMDTN